MSAIPDLIGSLRHELAAADESTISSDQLRTAIKRGVMFINRDFETGYAVSGDTIAPDLTDEHEELLLLASTLTCCRIEIARAARRPSFKAGNVSVDRSRAAGAWRELLRESRAEYQRIAAMESSDRMAAVKPLLYERGSVIEETE